MYDNNNDKDVYYNCKKILYIAINDFVKYFKMSFIILNQIKKKLFINLIF